MKNWYYILWSDAINYTRSSIRTIGVWKTQTSLLITFFMSVNIVVLLSLINKLIKLNIGIIFNYFEIIENPSINDLFVFLLICYLPIYLFNYYLVFHNNKWEKIRKKYPHFGGKLYKGYFFFSIALPLAPLVIGKIIYEIMKFLK